MTLPLVNAARATYFVCAGADKVYLLFVLSSPSSSSSHFFSETFGRCELFIQISNLCRRLLLNKYCATIPVRCLLRSLTVARFVIHVTRTLRNHLFSL
jgi:hypothetical protein